MSNQFEKGHTIGRRKGAKNRLSWAFLSALADDFEQNGAETIRICRIERPDRYLQIVAGLMPKELEITETKLTEIPDDELDAFIEYARRKLAERVERVGGGADSEANGPATAH